MTYGIDPAHNQALAGAGLAPPLRRAWVRNLGAPMSFPIVADGKVYVSVRHIDPQNPGTTITALSARNGDTLWTHSVADTYYSWPSLSYDRRRIFFAQDDRLVALDADTGETDWAHQTPGGIDEQAPTAAKGVVYAGLEALDESTGDLIWTTDSSNLPAPALSRLDLFTASWCPNVVAIHRDTGKKDWQYSPSCGGSDIVIPQYANGKVYVMTPATLAPDLYVFDASDGRLLSHHRKVAALPAFWKSTILYLVDSNLTAVNRGTGTRRWSFRGDDLITGGPVVVDGFAYVGSALGKLWAIKVSTGRVVWKTELPWPIYTWRSFDVWPDVVLGAGQGLLIVPAESHLVAYRRVG